MNTSFRGPLTPVSVTPPTNPQADLPRFSFTARKFSPTGGLEPNVGPFCWPLWTRRLNDLRLVRGPLALAFTVALASGPASRVHRIHHDALPQPPPPHPAASGILTGARRAILGCGHQHLPVFTRVTF